ncbi:hypothetical protein ACHAXR_012887 [Thalassiosira sp. AJA248-18]
MAPINEDETKGEQQSSHHERERLDALWATFRLPVPIATKGKYNNVTGRDGGSPSSTHHDEWLIQALDLLRLLHTMNRQFANPKARSNRISGAASSRSRIMKSQMTLAYSSLEKLERTFPSVQQQTIPNDDNAGDANQVFHQKIHHLLQKLRNDTEDTCAKFQRRLDSHNGRQQMHEERDIIYDIFLAPVGLEKESDHSDELEEFSIEGEGDEYEDAVAGNNANAQTSTPVQNKQHYQHQPTRKQKEAAAAASAVVDPVEFQKQQQELLEEELASMASRLKSSTLAMNVTLQTQTKELGDMETLAQTNLDTVTDTAQKVEERLVRKKGWKKRLATWSLIGTVVGMWVLCFVIMRTVPKRKVGKIHLFGKVRPHGRSNSFWEGWRGYFSKDFLDYFSKDKQRHDDGSSSMWEDQVTGERARHRERQDRERHDRERQEQQAQDSWQRQQQHRSQHQEQRQECEVLSDGTQICTNSGKEDGHTDATAHELAAARKRRRIEEKMANAPAVDAVDSSGVDEDVPLKEDIHSIPDINSHDGRSEEDKSEDDSNDPMGCIEITDEMRTNQGALDTLSKALEGLGEALKSSPEGYQRIQISERIEKIKSELKKYSSALLMEGNKARTHFWAERANRIKARDAKRSLGSIQFCGDRKNNAATDRIPMIPGAEERFRLEDERREKFQEEVRLAREAQKKGEQVLHERLEEERRKEEIRQRQETEEREQRPNEEAMEAHRLKKERLTAKAEKLKKKEEARRLAAAKAETARIEQDRLAAEAAKQSEFDRREEERADQERLSAEAEKRLKEEEEARQEAAKLDAERAAKEKQRMAEEEAAATAAAEAKRVEEEAEMNRLKEEEAMRLKEEEKRKVRNEQEKLATEQREEAARLERERLEAEAAEAERLENERLAAEAAELERLELERIERERILDEQRQKEEEKARRLAAEAAREEEQARQLSDMKAKAKAEAEQAVELSKQIAADNSDFLPSDVRFAAGRLKNDLLAHYISTSPEMVDASDRSGWRPIHEAARAGNLAGVELLVSAGSDLTSRTGRTGKGGTALWWAVQRFGEDHSVVQLLRSHGALEAGPA